MFNKCIKKVWYVVMIVSLVFYNCMLVNAKMNWNQKGSLTLSLKDSEGNVVANGQYVLYHVGNVDQTQNSLGFVYVDEFLNNGMSLNDLRAEGLANHLTSFVNEKNIEGMQQDADNHGVVKWNQLDLGLYLVVQSRHVDGYFDIDPFLVSIPLSENNGYIYDVNAFPKVELTPAVPQEQEITVKKVWKNNGNKIPDYIEVTLSKEHVIYETCQLNPANHWTHTWKNLSGEFQWTISEVNVPENYEASYQYLNGEIIITNTSEDDVLGDEEKTIYTGQLNWPIPVLGCLGIITFTIGWIMTFKKKEECCEK